jgi:hypothetical protein
MAAYRSSSKNAGRMNLQLILNINLSQAHIELKFDSLGIAITHRVPKQQLATFGLKKFEGFTKVLDLWFWPSISKYKDFFNPWDVEKTYITWGSVWLEYHLFGHTN